MWIVPGFLKGKYFGSCLTEKEYAETLALLFRTLGQSEPLPAVPPEELARLQSELASAKELLAAHQAEIARAHAAAFKAKSRRLQEAITAANKAFPLHKPINEAYAFEVGETIVTLDYLLWCVAKSRREGSHPIEILLSLTEKWGDAELMLEAYSDLLEA